MQLKKMALFCQQVISLELSTGVPMLYIFKEGKFIRRGSPSAPTDVGVYAYTKVCLFMWYFFNFGPIFLNMLIQK